MIRNFTRPGLPVRPHPAAQGLRGPDHVISRFALTNRHYILLKLVDMSIRHGGTAPEPYPVFSRRSVISLCRAPCKVNAENTPD